MSELMKDFCQTFITLILFYAILLLLINLLTLVKQKAHAHAPSFSPSTTVNINQYVTSTLDDYPDQVNKSQTYVSNSNITGKSRCYYPTKDGEQPYAEYKLNYFQ